MKLNSCAICCLFRSSAFPRNYIHRFCLVSAFVRPLPRSNIDLLSICKCVLLFCRDLYTRTYPGEWGCGVEKSSGVSRNEWNFVECFLFFFFFSVLNLGFFLLINVNWKGHRKRRFSVFWFWGKVKRKISGRNLGFSFYRRMERLFWDNCKSYGS